VQHPKRRRKHVKRSPSAVYNPDHRKWITAPQLCERFGNVSAMWPERMMRRDPDFPRPQYFGRFRFWDIEQIQQYERRAAARGGER
jgi:hypothetical protein